MVISLQAGPGELWRRPKVERRDSLEELSGIPPYRAIHFQSDWWIDDACKRIDWRQINYVFSCFGDYRCS
jgi:hypothetical protein